MSRRFISRMWFIGVVLALGVFAGWGQSADHASGPSLGPGFRNAVILIIRHAEKPSVGSELTPEGSTRARAYVDYFKHFEVDSRPLGLDWLVVANDSKRSQRPRLTLEPLSIALRRPLDMRFKARQVEALAEEIRSQPHGQGILICWHHDHIAELIRALGAQPEKLLPGGQWPASVFNWVLELRYDNEGRWIPGLSKRINENLMPHDATNRDPQQ